MIQYRNRDEEEIIRKITSIQEDLFTLAKELHAHPELSLEEFQSAEKTVRLLEKYGFVVEHPIASLPQFPTAFHAVYGKGPFHIAFLSEYDALPELGHACGHNLINMMSVGAAIGCQALSDRMTIHVFGCPAEETVGAKVDMAEAGLFKAMDACLIIHPGCKTEVGGTALATHPLEVTFTGRSAHVASLTDRGVNALDAAVQFYSQLQGLKKSFSEYALLGAIITEGGVAPNIIPDRATLKLTVRALKVEYLKEVVLPRVMALAEEVAKECGTGVDMHFYEPLYKDLQQDRTLTMFFKEVMEEWQEVVTVLPDDSAEGSTDVGNVSYEAPTAHPTLDIGSMEDVHTKTFAMAAGSTQGLEKSLRGACMMGIVALRYVEELEEKARRA